jgi:parvulin-like peptidyl-prolyl isomerase
MEREVRSAFGEEFTSAILELEPDRWEGPIRSGYGLHLVYLYHRERSYIPGWELRKPKIIQDMEMEARTAARELFYTEILRTYQIVYRGEALNVVEGGTGE